MAGSTACSPSLERGHLPYHHCVCEVLHPLNRTTLHMALRFYPAFRSLTRPRVAPCLSSVARAGSTSPALALAAVTTTRSFHSCPPCQSGLTNLYDRPDQSSSSDPAQTRLQVEKLNDQGFVLADGLIIPGGAIFIDDRAFLWDVDPVQVDPLSGRGKWEGWSREQFRIFEAVLPRPEILLLGTGKTVLPPPPEIRAYLSSLGIQLDVMDSVSVFAAVSLSTQRMRR